jgi:hypothetical protein
VVTVQWRTIPGTADESTSCPGGDYIQASGLLTFDPGVTSLPIPVQICGDPTREANETFRVELLRPVNTHFLTVGTATALATILNDDGATGTFALTPSDASVAVGERLDYAFSWSVPAPRNWHDLGTLEFRIKDEGRVVFAVLFDEASRTFRLARPGQRPEGESLRTAVATMDVAEASVVGSGPTGPDVLLNLPLRFNPAAAGRTYALEVAATGDDGDGDVFAAGTVTVLPGTNGNGDSGPTGSNAGTEIVAEAFPNPTDGTSSIVYSIPSELAASPVEIAVYDVAGRRVRTLLAEPGQTGRSTLDWDLRNEQGDRVSDGIYFYRIRVGTLKTTRKLVVVQR